MPVTEPIQGYRDIYFRLIIALIAAHLIITFGARESIFLLLISWFYWRDLLLSAAIAFALIQMVYWATVWLDRRFDWKDHPIPRVGLQVLLGLLLPCVAAFLLAAGYFALFGINILHTLYMKFDFPVVAIMLLLLNVYYLAFYFYRQWRHALNNQGQQQQVKEIYIVQKGTRSIPLPVSAIAYFYHEGGYNFLRSVDREDFVISQTLDEVQHELSTKSFFRANRQMLVNFTACQHFEVLEFGKLQLFVKPEPKEPVIISQRRAKPFREWMIR